MINENFDYNQNTLHYQSRGQNSKVNTNNRSKAHWDELQS